MTHTYHITGMTCGSCVARVRHQLLMLGDITEATVQLEVPQATITMTRHIPVDTLQQAVSKAGPYVITEADGGMRAGHSTTSEKSGATYKPLVLIGAYITGLTLLVSLASGVFHLEQWMNSFMGVFFLVFSFFKFLDLKGFAESYATYDIIAKRWTGWGYVYAFIELLLGIAFLLGVSPLLTVSITFVVMGISIIGVLQAVMNRRAIQCACLGTVFNLPMTSVTIVEDGLMMLMSGWMIFSMTGNF